MKKKGLVLAIVIAMLTSIIPSFAFATENNSSDEAITKAKEKYLQAEAEYKQGPVKFLEARLCDEHKNTHSKAGYEKALGDENELEWDGHQEVYDCYRAFCDDKNKEKLESNWFTFHRLDPPLHLPGLRRYCAGFVRPLVLQSDPPAPHRGPAAGVGGALRCRQQQA